MNKINFQKLTKNYIGTANVVVVKVGSALLVDAKTGTVKHDWLKSLGADIAQLASKGTRIVVVSSGSIALGQGQIAHGHKLKLEEKQAAAAIGQIRLASEWQQTLDGFDLKTAQILLSLDDTETRNKHLNARATLHTLLKSGIVPVVNENDTVATAEIRYGDNDRLAARVAQMISADALILLSDIDGLYTTDPKHRDDNSDHLPEVLDIDDNIVAMAGPANVGYASGGMITKIEAARIATAAGCHMVICDGKANNPVTQLLDGGRCTWFKALSDPPQARKKWIASGLKTKGTFTIDDGAVIALQKGKSLLAAGIAEVSGDFARGDLVAVTDSKGVEIGRGLSHYDATDARKIVGCNSNKIQGILGYRGRDEVIHADDLALIHSKISQKHKRQK